jgi:hypothetical protein
MEDPSVSFSKPKKKKSFSKEELVSSDLEETAGTGSLPKRKKSFPKEEPVTDPDESENKRVSKKKRTLSPKEEPLSSGPEEAERELQWACLCRSYQICFFSGQDQCVCTKHPGTREPTVESQLGLLISCWQQRHICAM